MSLPGGNETGRKRRLARNDAASHSDFLATREGKTAISEADRIKVRNSSM